MGPIAKKKTWQRSQVLGHKSKVTKLMYKLLISPSRNPVWKQPYEAQIAYHKIPIKRRQLQQKLKEHTKGGKRYLCAYIKKVISEQNHASQATYSKAHLYNPLFGFFNHIIYTNKAHVNPTLQAQDMVLREQGTRDNPENIKERPPLKGIRFHITT